MGIYSVPITPTTFYRQDTKPPDAADGATWLTNADGAGSDTTSRYVYNSEADRWELNSAVGPSEPNAGTPVPGATWRDTANGTARQYDGSAFTGLGIALSDYASESGTFSKNSQDIDFTGSISLQNTYAPEAVSGFVSLTYTQATNETDHNGGITDFNTDSDGNVIGFDYYIRKDYNADTDWFWYVSGIKA